MMTKKDREEASRDILKNMGIKNKSRRKRLIKEMYKQFKKDSGL